MIRSILLAVFACSTAAIAHANTPKLSSFEELARDAVFIGVVRCVDAGGIVARYEVVDAWKGKPAATTITIEIEPEGWEPQFPTVLVGDEFVVTAFSGELKTRIENDTARGSVPLWWRKIDADYVLRWFQGRVQLNAKPVVETVDPLREDFWIGGVERPKTKELPFEDFDSKAVDLAHLRAEFIAFAALAPDEQDFRVFRRVAAAHAEICPGLNEALRDVVTLETAIARLLASDVFSDEGLRHSSELASLRCPAALEICNRLARTDPKNVGALRVTIDRLERRLHPLPESDRDRSDSAGSKGSDEQLVAWRKTLAGGSSQRGFDEAFDGLTRDDPDAVAAFLMRTLPDETRTLGPDGYILGSSYAFRVREKRAAHFRRLLDATDTHVRVVGAVYLRFEALLEGEQRLSEFMKLPGDPGAWAALVLASHGRADAVERAIQVLADPGESAHRNLQKRLLVLLSNSARASGIELPPEVRVPAQDGRDTAEIHAAAREWWAANNERVRLFDPWVAQLDAQKVD